jgi:hypothetical protein
MAQGNYNHPGVFTGVFKGLPLALLVLRVLANDHNATAATNHAALFAHFADGGSDFHDG